VFDDHQFHSLCYTFCRKCTTCYIHCLLFTLLIYLWMAKIKQEQEQPLIHWIAIYLVNSVVHRTTAEARKTPYRCCCGNHTLNCQEWKVTRLFHLTQTYPVVTIEFMNSTSPQYKTFVPGRHIHAQASLTLKTESAWHVMAHVQLWGMVLTSPNAVAIFIWERTVHFHSAVSIFNN